MELRRRRSCQSVGPSPSFCSNLLPRVAPGKYQGRKGGAKAKQESQQTSQGRKEEAPASQPRPSAQAGKGDHCPLPLSSCRPKGGSCTHHSHHIFNSLWGVERAGRQAGGRGVEKERKRMFRARLECRAAAQWCFRAARGGERSVCSGAVPGAGTSRGNQPHCHEGRPVLAWLISCSPVSEAVISLQRACRAAFGKPARGRQAELEGLAAPQGAKVTSRGPMLTHQAKTGWCCCTAAVDPRGPLWGRRQRLEAHWLEDPAGSPLLSTGPASQGCHQLYSRRSAERCTWSCAAHCGCAARTSPPKREVRG